MLCRKQAIVNTLFKILFWVFSLAFVALLGFMIYFLIKGTPNIDYGKIGITLAILAVLGQYFERKAR